MKRAGRRPAPVSFASPVALAERPALGQHLRAGGPVDGAVDAPAAEQARVRRVDDRVGVLLGDVAEDQVDPGAGHQATTSMPTRSASDAPRGSSTSSTASRAAMATASWSRSGSRVVIRCSCRPGHIST